MKITPKQLRKIIKEEYSLQQERNLDELEIELTYQIDKQIKNSRIEIEELNDRIEFYSKQKEIIDSNEPNSLITVAINIKNKEKDSIGPFLKGTIEDISDIVFNKDKQ